MLTVTMPPPRRGFHANQRDLLLHFLLHLLGLLHHGLHISARHLHVSLSFKLRTARNLAFRKKFLKALHFRMSQRTLGCFICFWRLGRFLATAGAASPTFT
jgi:hypothetical protein